MNLSLHHHRFPVVLEGCSYVDGNTLRKKHNSVRDCISKGVVIVDHVHTDENLADSLTKWLVREKVHNTYENMGLMPIDKWVAHGGNLA